MFVLIIGGGRTGAQLARALLSQNYGVVVMEHRPEVLSRIHRELPTEVIFEGDPMNPAMLEQAGIKRAAVVAAVTTEDEVNLVICYIARERYGVVRTIARVNNPRDGWLFNGMFRVDVAVNQSQIMSRLIEEEMSMGDMMTLLKLRRGNYSLVEEKIPLGARVIGMEIRDMGLDHCIIAGIIRKGEMIMPRGVTSLEVGDEVLAVADPQGAHQLAELLAPPSSGNTPQ